jgi:Ala-tRNA(Pro) deacylase
VISELRAFLIREQAPFEVGDADGRRFAKVVALRDGDLYALAVLPAASALDLIGFRRRIGRYALTVANEDEFRGQFPELPRGPLMPFGRLLGIPIYLDRGLAEETAMTFESGVAREMVSMPMRDYVRAERPAIAPLARALRAA